MTHYEVLKKLIGNINPAGDSSIDDTRFENLEAMVEVANLIIMDLAYVTRSASSYESSVSKAGKYALANLKAIAEEINSIQQ